MLKLLLLRETMIFHSNLNYIFLNRGGLLRLPRFFCYQLRVVLLGV